MQTEIDKLKQKLKELQEENENLKDKVPVKSDSWKSIPQKLNEQPKSRNNGGMMTDWPGLL